MLFYLPKRQQERHQKKQVQKRTVGSLRVPLANTTDTSTTGVNTDDTLTGLNITV